jgi:hypothetical protein
MNKKLKSIPKFRSEAEERRNNSVATKTAMMRQLRITKAMSRQMLSSDFDKALLLKNSRQVTS